MLNVAFSEGFIVAFFFLSVAYKFLPSIFIICSLICLVVCVFFFVSVFLALLVFLFAFSPKLGCINVSRVYLRIVHSLNYSIIIIPFSSVRRC